jgi:hypothetical protein
MPDDQTPSRDRALARLLSVDPELHVRRHVADGERLLLQDLGEYVWLLARGEVVVYRAGRAIELWLATCTLDLAGSLRGSASASFVAVGSVELIGVPRARLDASLLAELLALESEQLWRRIEEDARRDDDTFLPWAVPVPGPWWFRRARAVAMVVQGDPDRIAACMPRGVRPLPGTGGRYVLVLAQFDEVGSEDARDPRRFSYREVTPFLPAWTGLRGPCAFVPELYPDAWMAVILGREIHGFPKRTARIGYRDDGGELLVDRKLALRVRWREREDAAPATVVGELARSLIPHRRSEQLATWLVDRLPERLGFAAVVRKRIGAPQSSGRSFEVDELVRVGVRLDPIRAAARLHGFAAELADGPGILHGQVLGGWQLHSGLRFGPGRALRRFRRGLRR